MGQWVLITASWYEESVPINRKYLPQYRIRNHTHFLLCSNSLLALRIAEEDRRWLIPGVTETKKDREWWGELYDWLNLDGYGIIMQWALDNADEYGLVLPGSVAPDTARKREMIEDARTPTMKRLIDLAEAAKARWKDQGEKSPVVLIDERVVDWVTQSEGLSKKPSAAFVRETLMIAGMKLHSLRLKIHNHNCKAVYWGEMNPTATGKELMEGGSEHEEKKRTFIVSPGELIEPKM